MNKQPIGIFDSGVGGTSIWKEIHALLPYENTIYLADSANAPYGPKGKDAIIALSEKNTEYLLNQNSKIIVVACNTATTNAIKHLRKKYDVPFIGIEPAIKPAALQTQTKAIGILATKGTLSSELFFNTSQLYSNGIEIIEQEGEGIVQLIESGNINSEEMRALLEIYLKPMLNANIDYLVLGCTHYPYLIPQLLKMLPKHIKIIDSGEAVARQTKAILKQLNLLNIADVKPDLKFYINSNPKVMSQLLNNNFEVNQKDF
ncbi:glutamate racemase [Mesoflavibacter sabulilitoris]|uniref:Glutamate racemase n=1 Tax=Mesoflavibacter zeaxanthinifaciens subsp. sabulilitoris TaxID=1520893 RepID=A0A2T1NLR8_9FLAO|nr:glutamate racemase [Mesoflavibacter zeaxanthinifaciens]MBB3124467.1 glutamate racemase [Mesoflavibacter zeaxanthinifaciens subsp. sabulilitoris]PSG93838.1 glutamate racemase [Mesoflavibacter zeaxanthinifaciens subsp. sabulilitoris]